MSHVGMIRIIMHTITLLSSLCVFASLHSGSRSTKGGIALTGTLLSLLARAAIEQEGVKGLTQTRQQCAQLAQVHAERLEQNGPSHRSWPASNPAPEDFVLSPDGSDGRRPARVLFF